jgi:hypothetical protein
MRSFIDDVQDAYRQNGLKYVCKELYLTSYCQSLSWIKTANKRYNHWRAGADYNIDGFDIFDETWDNLIILDACRYDIFEQLVPFEGQLESRTSRGSKTWEFIKGNFTGKQKYDTVYLADNPWYTRLTDKTDAELYHFKLIDQDSFDGRVAHPATTTDAAIAYNDRFDEKKLIVHYYQPHQPYFDEDGKELHRLESTCPARLHSMGFNEQEIVDAYKSTLRLAFDEIKRLLSELNGTTVITADHGELINDRMRPLPFHAYGHPEGVYVEELVKVPWFVIDHEENKEVVTADAPLETESADVDNIENRLQDLGYL